ncbi:MAG: MAE_28990/MAE_18760 family HEPN-like nuclease [Peptococcaceae bacterium]|jgi:hypothetical protein|nr:MAE_28990/MAE_18760 family HEPN-like nuclease [Peptococcaceae bacterium]
MKIRSQTELQDYLDGCLAGRKKELTTLHFIVSRNNREHERSAIIRAFLPLLYAHWEGFIKQSSMAYIKFVSCQRLPLGNLRYNFVAIALRDRIISAGKSKKTGLHEDLIDFIVDHMGESLILDPSVIDTEHNLSSRVLQDIMRTIGLKFDVMWEKKSAIIDQQLLRHRNEIVHGELISVDVLLFEQLHKFVLESMEAFKVAIENAILLISYKK